MYSAYTSTDKENINSNTQRKKQTLIKNGTIEYDKLMHKYQEKMNYKFPKELFSPSFRVNEEGLSESDLSLSIEYVQNNSN